ncbi:hypothetical protein chiPu_0031236, partial [Chiloscyllium punctatum]|nr:hypothetical protein [Chiloscyllium punctatum]
VGVFALIAELLADDAVLGEVRLDQPSHHRFGGAVGFGDRIEIVRTLVVDRKRGAEEGQDGFAGCGREAADEGGEVDDRHGLSLKCAKRRGRGRMRSCLAQSNAVRTINAALSQPDDPVSDFRFGFGFESLSGCWPDHEVASSGIQAMRKAPSDRGLSRKSLILNNKNFRRGPVANATAY